MTHGVVGGAFSEVRGQSFSSGFLAAGFSSAAAPLAPSAAWKATAFHAVVGGSGSVLGGGKFANGAVTGAFTYLFNEAIQPDSPDSPDFSSMTNQEIADWLEVNAGKLGVELPDGVDVVAIDGYADQYGNPCSDRLCGGTLDLPVYGSYLNGVISLYIPAFEAGFITTFTRDADGNAVITGRRVRRVGAAVQTFGHEAAHARGIDLVPGLSYHPNAEAAGNQALQNFRNLYCGGKRC